MKFRLIENRADWNVLSSKFTARQWVSEGAGLWTGQLDLFLYGVRFHLGHVSDPWWFYLDYCCGQNPIAQILIPSVVFKALECAAETASIREVVKRFPSHRRKPMHNDPDCWAKLCGLAGIEVLSLEAGADVRTPVLADSFLAGQRSRRREGVSS